MNRTALIIISVLCFITSVSFVYAFIQQGFAKEQKALAEANATMAQKNAEEAMKQAKLAQEQMENARVQQALAEQALRDCMSKKK